MRRLDHNTEPIVNNYEFPVSMFNSDSFSHFLSISAFILFLIAYILLLIHITSLINLESAIHKRKEIKLGFINRSFMQA